MKKRSDFCLLHTERASAPAAEKERLTGIGWRSSSDMDGAADFQDFANDYYAWFSEKGVEHNDAPKGFCSEHFAEYFADSCPDPYEWVAVEWSCDLLMQLVSIEGGRVDYENFEECGKLDLDWVSYMLEIILETVCERLTSAIVASNRKVDSEKSMIQVHNSLAQKIVKYVQNDLQMALLAAPAEYEALRNYFNMDSDRKRREYGYGRINSSVC